MSIEDKPSDKATSVKLSGSPQSATDSLLKTAKPEQHSFFKSKTFYILLGVGLLIISIVVFVIFTSFSKPEPKTQALEQQSTEEIQMLREQAAEEEAAKKLQEIDPAISQLPLDDFVFAADPIKQLSYQSTNGVINDLPEYRQDGAVIVSSDGRMLAMNDPYLAQAEFDVFNIVAAYTENNRLLEQRSQAGTQEWYIRQGLGFEDEDFVKIQTAVPAANLRSTSRNFAAQEMREKLEAAPWQMMPVEVPEQQIVYVDPALTEEERDRLLSIVETQRTNNLELVRKNKELRDEKVEIKSKIVDLVQRIEDNPNIGAKLRATMIPAESGWKVSAIVGDRIYLVNKDGVIETLSQGDNLPDSNLIISHADENTGIVLVTPAN